MPFETRWTLELPRPGGSVVAGGDFLDTTGATFQVLLVSSVIQLGASEQELARFPGEVRKARYLAE